MKIWLRLKNLSKYKINKLLHGKCFVRYLRIRCFCIRKLVLVVVLVLRSKGPWSYKISSYVFIPSECKHVASSNPSVNIFRNVYLASPAFDLFPLPCSFTPFASSFQTFPYLVKLVVEKGLRHICLLKNFSCLLLLSGNSLSKLTSRPIAFLSESFCSALPGCYF